MADIKRPNYFTAQFLVEKDFNDEQGYHLNSRRRHQRALHTSGVAEGLAVTRVSGTQVQVGAGNAIDKDGREIVLDDARIYTIATPGSNVDIYFTIAYHEDLDPADQYTQAGAGLDKFTRTTERPLLQDSTVVPPTDGSVIVLARIHLNASGAIESDSSVDATVRTLAGAKLAPGSVDNNKIADGSVTLAKLALNAVDNSKVADGAITLAKLAPNSVDASKIVDKSVGTAELADGSVTAAKLASNSVNSDRLVDFAVTTGKIAAGAVDNTKLLDQVVNTAKIGDNAVTLAKLAPNSVDAVRIVDGAVGTSELADGAVTLAKLAAAVQPVVSVNGLANPGGNIGLVPNGAITIDNNFVNKQIIIGESHSGIVGNPHNTTAAQIGALPAAGGDISGMLRIAGGTANLHDTRGSVDNEHGFGRSAGKKVSVFISDSADPSLGTSINTCLQIIPTVSGVSGLNITAATGGDTITIGGTARFSGTKIGYVADTAVNSSGETLRTGDIVKLKPGGHVRFHGDNNRIPIPEVTLADSESDPLVFGVVAQEATPLPDAPDTRAEPDDPTSIPPGGELFVVTLGAFAHCKVDASTTPIRVGDLLTTSVNPGHAMRATDPKVGTIIGKALEPLDSGTGYISVFVNIQ